MFLAAVLLCYVNVFFFSVCSGDHRFNTLLLQDDLKPKFDFNKTNVWKILENQEWPFLAITPRAITHVLFKF